MKLKRFFALSFIALLLSFSAVSVYATEDESVSASEYVEDDTEPETEETEDTEPETEETYDDSEDETQETYAVLDNDLKDLPEADTAPTPTAPRKKSADNSDFTYGIVSWACVIIGLLAVLIVIISNKSHYYGGGGKQRYDDGDKITGQKRLLNDEYYNNRTKQSYYSKDTRR